jgi:hypothetical protein
MTDKPIRFYNDDGTEINPDILSKPALCTTCARNDDPSEEPLCILNRLDQEGREDFKCGAYVPMEE